MFRKILLIFVLSLLIILPAFTSGEEEGPLEPVSDRYSFSDINELSISVPFDLDRASTYETSIHQVILILSSKYPDSINTINIDADFLTVSINLDQSQFMGIDKYEYDTNPGDENSGEIITVETEISTNEKTRISISKKPITGTKGTFSNLTSFNISAELADNADYIGTFLAGYTEDGLNVSEIESDALIRLTIPPEISISPGENPIKTAQKIPIEFSPVIKKTQQSVLSHHWDFSDQSADSFEEFPGIVNFPDIGSYTITYTVTDDYGFTAQHQTIVEVAENLPPSAPVLLGPLEDDIVSGSNAVFYWEPSIDPEFEDITYQVIISENSDLLLNPLFFTALFPFLFFVPFKKRKIKPLIRYFILSMTFVLMTSCPNPMTAIDEIPENAVTFTYTQLENNKEYFWKVIAADSSGNTSESEIRRFRTK